MTTGSVARSLVALMVSCSNPLEVGLDEKVAGESPFHHAAAIETLVPDGAGHAG
jgi:hypothetical protein